MFCAFASEIMVSICRLHFLADVEDWIPAKLWCHFVRFLFCAPRAVRRSSGMCGT